MRIEFNCISELGAPGPKFKKLFDTYWPEYKSWLDDNTLTYLPSLDTSIAALKEFMPEMLPVYQKLCKLVDADPLAAQFLTGFQPPPYLSACSQAVLVKDEIQLVRNYDFHHSLLEGTLFLSSWHGKKVMATTDCIMGAIDGMNENGLAISLTFGGRKVVGEGFGIPFILRYVLEFCNSTEEAVKALLRIPSHMSYNLTVVDKDGVYKTILLSPDSAPIVTNDGYTTNHQTKVEWLANATFNKTIERAKFLGELMKKPALDANALADAFLKKPLYNNMFSKGFGTLYTVDYRPLAGTTQLRWLDNSILQSFDNFTEVNTLVRYYDGANVNHQSATLPTATDDQKIQFPKNNTVWEIIPEYSKKIKKKRRKFSINNK